MKFLAALYRFFLSLRYNVHIKGEEVLKSNNSKFILPNHQAVVDPQLLYVYLRKYTEVMPVASENYFKNPLLKAILSAIGTVSVSDLTAGSRDQNVLKTIYGNVTKALSSGKSVLLYPAGQIAGQGYEKIFNKQSAWAVVKDLPENTKVIGVRINGLWGSMWSRAWIGRTPDFFSTFLKGLFYVFANLIFFIPRRKVTIEFEDITDLSKEKSQESRANFNNFLEDFYNKKGEESVLFLKHYFYSAALTRKLPERIEFSVNDLKGKSFDSIDIPNEVLTQVIQILVREAEIKVKNIKAETNLSLDLNIDSLGLVNIVTAIETEFNESSQIEITDIKTVADLCDVAMGRSAGDEILKPSILNKCNIPLQRLQVNPVKNIVELVFENFYKYPNESYAYDKIIGSTTRKEFLLKAMVVSKIIRKEVPGKHVGIMLPALQSTALLVMATYLAGKIPVMLNWTVGKKVLEHCVDTVNLKQILTAGTFYEKVEELLPEKVKERCIFFEKKVKELGLMTKLSGLFSYYLHRKPAIKMDDTAVVLFTSGSESLPKAVPLSHKNIVSDIWGVFQDIKIYNNQIILSFLPPFHSFGFSVLTILPLITGIKIAYTPDPTDNKEVKKILRHTKANILMATPTFLRMLLNAARSKDLESLHMVITGAESLHPSLIEMVRTKIKQEVTMLEGYGITECSPILSITPQEKQKLNSVGKMICGVKALIVDINTNKPLPQGTSGMILVSGNNVFNGYLDPEIESPFVFIENIKYYKTGDLGYFDEEGFLFITGRLKRFLKIAGEMISLPAIENILLQKYGNPDKTVLAVEGSDTIIPPQIVLFAAENIDINEANAYLKTSGFSNLIKIHRIIEIEEIPLLGTGKTDYRTLKDKIA